MRSGSGSPTSRASAMVRATRSDGVSFPCASNISAICAPMRISGLSAVIGSWNTIAILRPRSVLQRRGVERQQVLALERDLAGTGADTLRQQPHQRMRAQRFARAGFADHAEDLARMQIERHVLHRMRALGPRRQVERQIAD